ncbi:MAG: right-handed parallel beta-helix repeat-containing protein [Candidatus Micrarchaeia archaeon]
MNGALAVCGNLLVDTTLSGAETAPGTCFTFGADNIVLDCAGNSVSVTGGTAVPAIDVARLNITIRNCQVLDTSATNVAMGAIRLTAAANQTKILDTNVTSIGHYALYVLSQSNNFTNVRTTTSSQNQYGAYFSSSSNNVFSNVVINKTATVNTYALYYYFGDSNVFDNVVVSSDVTTSNVAVYGAYLYGVTNSNITGSTFTARNLPALYLQGGSNYNTLRNLTVRAYPTATATGIQIDTSTNSNVFDSNINTSGISLYVVSSAGYIWMENLTISSNYSSGIYIASSSGTSDYNTINQVNSNAYSYPLSFYQGSSNNVVANSTFNSNNTNAFYAFSATSSNTFLNNTFRSRLSGGAATAVVFTASSSSYNVFRGNTIYSPTSHALYFTGTSSSNNIIDGNNITAQAGTGYGVTFAAASSNSNNVTSNNISSVTGYGVQLYGDYNNVIGNNISGYTIAVYLAYSTSANVSENVLSTNSTTGANAVVYLASSDSNTFANNTMNHTKPIAAVNYGVLLSTSSSNTFTDNSITTYGNDGVRITTTSLYNRFLNNRIYTNATNYYGAIITTNCNSNEFRDNNITSWNGYGAAIYTNSRYNLFTGGNITAGTQAGFYISSANNNNVTNTTITTGAGDRAGSVGIYLTVASGNRLSGVNVTSNASYAIQLTAGVSGSTFTYINAYSIRSNALYLYNDVTYNAFSHFNFTSNLTAISTNGNPSPVAYNNFTNGSITANQTSGYAVYLYYGANNNVFSNVTIANTGLTTTAGGVYFLQASNNNAFYNATVTAANVATSYGVLAQTLSTNNTFYNSVIVAEYPGTGYDVYVGNAIGTPSTVTLVNTSFDPFSVTFGDTASSLTVSWYLRANVSDLTGATPVEGANVIVIDKYGNLTSNSTTDSGGLTAWGVARQYRQVSGSSTNYYPYNFTVATGTAEKNQSQSTLTESTTTSINMNASVCGLISSDYTLTNNVYGSGGCFQAGGSGITLNCAGYYVNYSRSSAGCGFSANLMNGITLKNCRLVQGNYNSSSSGAFCLTGGSNATLANSTITARGGGNGYDFHLTDSSAYAVNASTNSSNSYFSGTSNLFRQWYLNFNLTDLAGSPMPMGQMEVNNTLNQTVASANVTDGVAPMKVLAEYLQTGASAFVFYSNFTIYGWTGNTTNYTSFNLTSNRQVTMSLNASACGIISESTVLKNSLYSSGTCLVAGASGITIDCAGHTINYSRSGNGFYGLDTSSQNSLTIKNCNFAMGNASATDSYGVFFNQSNGVVLANSSIAGRSALFNYSSQNAQFINTAFDNSSLVIGDGTSNLTVSWYANVHVVGLANEDVNGAAVNVTNSTGTLAANATTNATGRADFLLTEYAQSQSSKTMLAPYNFTATHPATLMSASNYTGLNGSQNLTIQVISASIAVLTPNESQIFFQGQTVNITVNVTLGTSWVTNVTVEVANDLYNLTYQATQVGSSSLWEYLYSIDPAQPAATLTITARGYNGTANVNATRNFIATRSGGTVNPPVVNYFCPLQTYVIQNQSTNVTVTADLDTILYSMALTVTYPNGSTATPSAQSTLESPGYIYTRTWLVNATQVGNYSLYVDVRDVNDNRANQTKRMHAALSNMTANLTATGISSLHLNDVCSGFTVASGASLNGVSVPPGNYSIIASESNRTNITFYQFNISSYSGNFLAFAEESASGLDSPANRRNVFLFDANASGEFYKADVLVNYSQYAGSLVAENSLEIDTCASRGNCSWSRVNATLNTTSKLINGTVSNISGMHGIFEPAFPTPLPDPVYAAYPKINLFAPHRENVQNGTNVTVYLNTTLEGNRSDAVVFVTFPSGLNVTLTNMSVVNSSNITSNRSYFTWNYTYSFIANETGTYSLHAFVNDTYRQNSSAAAYLTASEANASVALTSYGLASSSLLDAALNETVLSGTNVLSGEIWPGNFTFIAASGNASLSLWKMRVNQSMQVLNFTNLTKTAVTAPANRSPLYLFEAENFTLSFERAQVVINYSGMLADIVTEAALEVWTCASAGSCPSMTRINATIDTENKTVRFNRTSIGGVYGLYQAALATNTMIDAAAPVIILFAPNISNALYNSNVTIHLRAQLGTNLSSATVNLTYPSGGWSLLPNASYANGTNYTYNFTYVFYTNETGRFAAKAMVIDAYNQNATPEINISSSTSTGIVITSYGMENTSVVDPGMNITVLAGGNVLVGTLPTGNYSFAGTAGNHTSTLRKLYVSGIMTALNHTALLPSAVSAPANRSAVYLFEERNFSLSFESAQVEINYTEYLPSIVSEPALEVWGCASVGSCTLARLNATIDLDANTIAFNDSFLKGVYGLYQATQGGYTPVNAPAPSITLFAPNRTIVARNTNVTVRLNAQLGANLSTASVTVTKPTSGAYTLANISYSNGSNYTYNYTYEFYANETGAYTLAATVADQYSQNATAASALTAVAFNSAVVITSYGLNASSLVDSGATVLSGASVLSGSIPLGNYDFVAVADNTTITLAQLTVSGNMDVLNYTNLSTAAVAAPANRSALYLFHASNFSVAYGSAYLTINYTGLLPDIVSEAALEIWSCPDIASCTLARQNATAINATLHTASLNGSVLQGVYGLYQASQEVTTVVPVQTPLPSITRFAPSLEYVQANGTVTVYLEADLGINLSAARVNLTYPSGMSRILENASYANGSNYTYNYTYSFVANETGAYALSANVSDIYGQVALAYANVTAQSSYQEVNITSFGTENVTLYDPGTGTLALSGAPNASGNITPGNYTTVAQAPNVTFNFSALEVAGGDVWLMNWSALAAGAVSPPGNRSALYLFAIEGAGANYSSVSMKISYAGFLPDIITESALEVWSCGSVANCTMANLGAAIDASANTATASLATFAGVYGLYQASQTINTTINNTVVVTQYQSSSYPVTKEVKVNVTKNVTVEVEVPVEIVVQNYTSVRILSGPSSVEMRPQETAVVEISLSNGIGRDMGLVELSVQAEEGVEASLDKKSVVLAAGASDKAILTLKSGSGTGTRSVKVSASVPLLDVEDGMAISVTISPNLEKDKLAAQERITFAAKLISDNPECLDLKEGLTTAAVYLDSGKYLEADARAQKAISSCSGIMALRGKPTVQTEVVPQVDLAASLAIPVAFLGAAGAAALAIFMFTRRKGGKRAEGHGRQQPPKQ